MEIVVRKAEPNDVQSIMGLVRELALFEKAPDEVVNNEEKMLQDGFGVHPAFQAFVAEDNVTATVVGICLYYTAYSTWKGKYCFLDDIVVTEKYRQYGIGRKLMNAFLRAAKENNISHIRWQVLDWNENAIKFYKSLGAHFDKEWYTCKMNGDTIEDYLQTQS
jgi:ribosomal protein S18 acetylase RimI-like enzyme